MKTKSILSLCGASSGRPSSLALAVALAALLSPLSNAANRTWSGVTDANWSTTTNWSVAPVSGTDTLVFAGSTRLTNTNDLALDFAVTGLSFTNTNAGGAPAVTGNFAITGVRITLGGNITTTAIGASPSPATITDNLGLAMILTGNRTVTTNTSHSLTLTGIISEDATPPRSLTKAGAATLTLQGANSFTGSLQLNEGTLTLSGAAGAANLSSGVIVNGGTFNLTNTNAANNADRLNDSGTVAMSGGTFNLGNNAGAANYAETTGALTINAGANTISSGQAALSQTSALTFASLARNAGATVIFGGTGLGATTRNQILITANPTLSNGLIGSWATLSSTDWASYDATNGVIALASYVNDTWAAGNNTTVTTSTAPTTASETHSIRFNLAAADTVTLDGSNTISSGGILVAPAVAGNVSTITGGTLQGSVGGELVIQQHNNTAGGGLTIGSIIQNNTSATSLVKTGGGLVTLTGTNTYTGGTVVNGGNLILINSGAGETLQGPITLGGSARLVLGKSDQISDTSVITFASGANSGRFQLNNAASVSYNETVGGINDAAGAFLGSRIVEAANDNLSNAPGVLTINTAGSSYTFGGFVRNAAGAAAGSLLTLVKDGLGTQEFSGAAGNVNYSGSTTVKVGTLKLSGTNSVLNNSAVSLEGGTVEFNGGGTRSTAISSTVSTGGVNKTGTGILTFTGDNTYTCPTTVSNGTLKLDRTGGTLADTGTLRLTADTAILDVAQSDTIGTLDLAQAATVSGVGTLTVTTAITPNIAVSKTNAISASLAGTAQLKKTGQGTTILSAANSYSGGTWLNGTNSKLTLSGSGTLGSSSGTLLIDTASAILDLGTTSQTVGAVTLTAGTIQNGTLTGSSYAIAAGTVSAALGGGSGVALTKTTAGTATLSGTNTYTGDTTVSGGTLAITGNSIANGNKLVIDGGLVDLTGAETVGTLFFGAAQQSAGTYTSDGAGGTIPSANFTGAGTLIVTTGPAGGYASWMAPFITGGLTGDTTATGDPDNDGMINLLEYALNGNPGTSDPSILPDLVVTTTDFEFTYSRLDLSLSDTVQTFEYGDTLIGWTPVLIPAGPGVSTVGIATVTVTDAGSTDTVKVSILKSAFPGGKLFGRLQVVK